MFIFIVTKYGRISRILKVNNSSKKEKRKRACRDKNSPNVFKELQFANLPLVEVLGNNGPKVYSVRPGPRTRAFKNQV